MGVPRRSCRYALSAKNLATDCSLSVHYENKLSGAAQKVIATMKTMVQLLESLGFVVSELTHVAGQHAQFGKHRGPVSITKHFNAKWMTEQGIGRRVAKPACEKAREHGRRRHHWLPQEPQSQSSPPVFLRNDAAVRCASESQGVLCALAIAAGAAAGCRQPSPSDTDDSATAVAKSGVKFSPTILSSVWRLVVRRTLISNKLHGENPKSSCAGTSIAGCGLFSSSHAGPRKGTMLLFMVVPLPGFVHDISGINQIPEVCQTCKTLPFQTHLRINPIECGWVYFRAGTSLQSAECHTHQRRKKRSRKEL
ncbi:uncharacterized protein LOC128352853 [Hemicordylus capensis]|uniref:uncharacterized protein LOC128352853 n=1 Tax=Hemicordylus capensis TaxID=884348 RepID=UPI002302A081|nr:uncharacterized protein LOC128352853 [Hemicordylus capensis]